MLYDLRAGISYLIPYYQISFSMIACSKNNPERLAALCLSSTKSSARALTAMRVEQASASMQTALNAWNELERSGQLSLENLKARIEDTAHEGERSPSHQA